MKVFVFCIAILLATAAKASPVNSDEAEVSSNEINVEDLSEDVEFNVDPLPEVHDDPVPEPFQVVEEEVEKQDESLDEEIMHENEVENENSELIGDEEPEAMPYDDEEKADDETPKLTPEQMEVVYGIEIDLCNLYPEMKNPLHLSHLTDCGKFYKCYNGRGYLMDCPAGEHWAVNLDRCDYPGVARCKIDGAHHYKIRKTKPMQASEQVEEEADDDKAETGDFEIDPRCEGSDPFKPAHYKHVSDCTKFYKCYMGRAYVIKCPRGQQWAQQLNRCEHPSIAKCSIKPTAVKPPGVQAAQAVEENSESESSEEEYEYDYYDNGYKITEDDDYIINDVRCLGDDVDRFHPIQFAHPTDCSMFYKCFDHHAYKSQCPFGLHFNDKEDMCDFPEEAECQVGIVEAQAQQTYNQPSVPACPKDQDVNFPVEGSLTQYFSCQSGLAYLMECQDHELFNPIAKNCEKVQFPMMPNMPNGAMPQFPGGMMPNFPGMQFPEGMPNFPQFPQGMMPNFPGMQFPEGMPNFPQFPQGMPNFPGMQFPEGMPNFPQFPQGMPNFPGMQFPEGMPNFPFPMMPQAPNDQPESQNIPQIPINRPTRPNLPLRPEQPQVPQQPEEKPEFPSWMPVPNPNVQPPKAPSQNVEKPSHEKPEKNEFNYSNGKPSSKCPSSDNPTKPQHLEHESDCNKFYKCYNGRAFLMECPLAQEWSDELQRCDYPQFAKCNPAELIKKKMQL